MILLTISALISLIIPMVVLIIAAMISKKTMNDREKSSPFECGFDPKSSARMPFSLQFFLIAVIFLIFDVEIALILPIVIIMNNSSMILWTMTTMFFIIILLVGLYHEWNQGALKWAE